MAVEERLRIAEGRQAQVHETGHVPVAHHHSILVDEYLADIHKASGSGCAPQPAE